jgi:hypothetical protein
LPCPKDRLPILAPEVGDGARGCSSFNACVFSSPKLLQQRQHLSATASDDADAAGSAPSTGFSAKSLPDLNHVGLSSMASILHLSFLPPQLVPYAPMADEIVALHVRGPEVAELMLNLPPPSSYNVGCGVPIVPNLNRLSSSRDRTSTLRC